MEENKEEKVEVQQEATKELKFNALALTSFICSMVGIFTLHFPCGVVALIMGIIGIVKFDKQKEKGKWMAITGLTVGAVEVICVLFFICFSFFIITPYLY